MVKDVPSSRQELHLLLLCILLAAIIPNLSTLGADFTFDDLFAVQGNQDLHPNHPWTDILIHDFWGQTLSSTSSHKSFRPLTTLSFRWNYSWAELNPALFHATNVVLHAIASVLVFFLASQALPRATSHRGQDCGYCPHY